MKATSSTIAAVHELAAAIADDPGARRKNCPACGETFACLPGECWCASLRLSPATLKTLSSQYESCLCPACLLPLSQ